MTTKTINFCGTTIPYMGFSGFEKQWREHDAIAVFSDNRTRLEFFEKNNDGIYESCHDITDISYDMFLTLLKDLRGKVKFQNEPPKNLLY